jgi:hypothetical protein
MGTGPPPFGLRNGWQPWFLSFRPHSRPFPTCGARQKASIRADCPPRSYPRRVLHGQVRRLFQGIVAAGTALGCSGRSTQPDAPPDLEPQDMSTVRSAEAASPAECDHPEQFACTDFGLFSNCFLSGRGCATHRSDNCRCDSGRPTSPAECDAPQQFTCESLTYDGHPLSCRCDSDAPATPADCARPQEFRCAATAPLSSCVCDLTAPGSADDCDRYNRFECQSYDPPVGCICTSTIILR